MDEYGHALQAYVSAFLGPLYKEMQYWNHAPERERREQKERPAVYIETDDLQTHEPSPYPGVRADHAVRSYVPRRREYRRHFPRRVAGDYARTLEKAAEYSNNALQKAGSRSRFCIFERDGKLFLDIVQMDRKGNIRSERTREMTHDDFVRSINDVRDIEGLLIDDSI